MTTPNPETPRLAGSRKLLIGLSALVLLLMIGGAVSFVRYARTHAPDPQLVAVAPFDIFVPGLEPWRVRLAEVVTDDLTAGARPAAVSQTIVRERWRGASRPEVAAVELARRTSAGAAVYGRIDSIPQRSDSVRAQVIVADASTGLILYAIVKRWPKTNVDGLAHALAAQLRQQFPKTP